VAAVVEVAAGANPPGLPGSHKMIEAQIKTFSRCESGAVAATYALSLFALIAVAGVGFDYARMAGMHSELQNAADQAALAGASQLDEETGACSRAATAAASLLRNESLLGRAESGSLAVSIATETTCDAVGKVRFWQDVDKTTAATSDANAGFIEVIVDERTADYALTPVIGLLNSGALDARAMAGVSSAVCEVPPLMVCLPGGGLNPGTDAAPGPDRGIGIKATSHTAGNAWAPGDFGFLEVGAGTNADLAKAIAYNEIPLDCVPAEGTLPETGNAQVLYEAMNTRLDIYPQGNDAPLNVCRGGVCPAAANNVKDLINPNTGTLNDNQCRIGNSGWRLPDNRFRPQDIDTVAGTFNSSFTDSDGVTNGGNPVAMGYSRDLCHYNSYDDIDCDGAADLGSEDVNRFGDGDWPRYDYFQQNHGIDPSSFSASWNGSAPATSASTWTRYQTYVWEQTLPSASRPPGYDRLCSVAAPGDIDRRILTVAGVSNCAALAGGSTAVVVFDWYDMFLVEPVVDDNVERANGRDNDQIYLELIRRTTIGTGTGANTSQAVRRDVPYLVR